MQGVTSPLAGQMFFRASLFGAFGESKRWLGKNADGSSRALTTADFYKAGAITGFIAAFTAGPIDFYKSQIQVQIIKSKVDPAYKREWRAGQAQRPAVRPLRGASARAARAAGGRGRGGASDAPFLCSTPLLWRASTPRRMRRRRLNGARKRLRRRLAGRAAPPQPRALRGRLQRARVRR
jgi:hypothetical protein